MRWPTKRTTEEDGLFEVTLTNSLHNVVAYNPGEMMVLKCRGAEPRNAKGTSGQTTAGGGS